MTIELPLLPLDVVLFPGEDLPLHIFEPRYRLMINECIEQKTSFGIVLVRPNSEHLKEEPYAVGTMANIEVLDRLEDGRMNLIARGLQRFRILEPALGRIDLRHVVQSSGDSRMLGTQSLFRDSLSAGKERKSFHGFPELRMNGA